jgi:ElaB/YqjD/DUF883 family membrane-anchored ribosome-binding protein
MVSRINKYFGSESNGSGSASINDIMERIERWTKHNPLAAIAVAAVAGVFLAKFAILRGLVLPIAMFAIRQWMSRSRR